MTPTRIIIHCSATPNGRGVSAEEIERWHVRDNGWSDIGYHGVIELTGIFVPGRNDDTSGAHVRGHNHDSLGLCLVGTDKFTGPQWDTLLRTLEWWQHRHGISDADIFGHNEFANKLCPGFDVRAWVSGGRRIPGNHYI